MRTVTLSVTMTLRTARSMRKSLRAFRDYLAGRMSLGATTPETAQATTSYVGLRTLESVLDHAIANAVSDAREDEARKGPPSRQERERERERE